MKASANILVVDDNSDLLNTFALILRHKGYTVETAEDGVLAVDKFKTSHFDVTLMDLIMPRMNGVEAFRRIKEINPSAKVILMTAYYEEEQIKEALHEGAYSAVHKPVNIARLIDLISQATVAPPVLVVDDDPDFGISLCQILQKRGHRVTLACSGEEAVMLAQQLNFAIAFIDVKMPAMSGIQASIKLKEINPNIMTVMMTGYRDEVKELLDSSSLSKCLYKPFDISQILNMVESSTSKVA